MCIGSLSLPAPLIFHMQPLSPHFCDHQLTNHSSFPFCSPPLLFNLPSRFFFHHPFFSVLPSILLSLFSILPTPAAPSSILNCLFYRSYSPSFHPLHLFLSTHSSVFTDDIMEQSNEFPVPKSASISGLIPRAPTGSEWSPSKPSRTTRQRGSDSDILEFEDVLRDLDKKAV